MNITIPKGPSQLYRKYPVLVWGLIIFSILVLIRIISGFNGLYGQDSYEYLRYSRRLTEFFISGKSPGDYFWPVNFPLLGAILSLIIGNNIIALQLISMLSFVFTAFYSLRLIQLIYSSNKEDVIYYLSLFLILSPFLFRTAFLVMSDILALFLSTAAIYYIVKYQRGCVRTDFLIAIFFATSAVMTRYAAAVVLFIPGIYNDIRTFVGEQQCCCSADSSRCSSN